MRFIRMTLIYSIIGMVVFLFFIKSKVQNLSKEFAIIESKIIEEIDNIHILKAEFAHLAKPQTIERLAEKNLELQVMNSDQFVSIQIDNNHQARIFEKLR